MLGSLGGSRQTEETPHRQRSNKVLLGTGGSTVSWPEPVVEEMAAPCHFHCLLDVPESPTTF